MYSLFKRLMDIVFALFLLLLTFPIQVILLIAATLIFKGQPLFFQKRIGYRERSFTIVKFRSMNNALDAHGQLLPDSQRMGPFGKLLRATSLDELPQLLLIIKGTMSFVGPRPLLPEYLELYSDTQKRRHEVKPGLSGWSQVKGRNNLSWTEKLEKDVWYVDNQNLGTDLNILLVTIGRVLSGKGVNPEGSKSVQRFNGSN